MTYEAIPDQYLTRMLATGRMQRCAGRYARLRKDLAGRHHSERLKTAKTKMEGASAGL